ncbi:hypothetical protein NQT62_13110 [Limnobacter humi]|uniref:Uncharacterized protein n=1 Tax=Limnobacter humi TaxID=1778671 RepID=A0ABT1WIZ4_9BURK|nr:hypothetical protein [Limnobacter humi]MCQ8897374.1 hypothetical protein [Limnobacter humi]
MDQATTLRKLLGQTRPVITPILGDMGFDYAACLARFILERHARQHQNALVFDASVAGLRQLLPADRRQDVIEFFKGRLNLEDQVVELADGQYLSPAMHGLSALAHNVDQVDVLLSRLHRLPVTCDRHFATLPYESWKLAAKLAPSSDWYWVVQPTANSVTRVFQAIRNTCGVDQNIHHRVIVAGVKGTDEADHVFANLLETTSGFLSQPLQYAGHLPALALGQPLSMMGREMMTAGRRVAKLVCALEEHALAE